jgi:hypothetical protein
MEKVIYFDPVARAYREINLEDAERFIASAKELEKKLAEKKGDKTKKDPK